MSDPWVRREQIGDCTLYQGDCLEVMPHVGPVGSVLTDPPYGLGKRMQGGTWGAQDHNSGFLCWDLTARQEWIDALLALDVPAVIWGANYYQVPPARCWLIWNKVNAVPTMADFEQAWTNCDRPAKRIDLPVGRVEFGHPTQKPLALMQWCLGFLSGLGAVLDPFMGSGTTLVACAKAGRPGIGIERDPEYFDIACARVAAAYAQPDLFIPRPVAPVQGGFDL